MRIQRYRNITPQYPQNAYIDEYATVIGKVTLGENVSLWPQTVLRGDVNEITIGDDSNIQDGAILHVSRPTTENPQGHPLIIGQQVTIGHAVCLHGCHIHDRVLVGIGTIVLDGAIVESDVMIGAGSLVPPHKRLKSGYLYLGQPVKAIRPLTPAEKDHLIESAQNYVDLKNEYLKVD